MSAASTTRGVVYIAFGERYAAETRRSLRSVQRRSPTLQTAVITDAPWSEEPQPSQWVLRPRDITYGSKPRFLFDAAPFDESLYLDSDTVLARDIAPLFDLLKDYEMGVRVSGPELPSETIPRCHPYATSCLIVFRRTPNVARTFELWRQRYEEARATWPNASPCGPPDDRFLGQALARSGVRWLTLPTYALLDVAEPAVLFSPPIVVHGRWPELEYIAETVVEQWPAASERLPCQRVWMPNIRGFLPAGIRRSDPFLALSLAGRRLLHELRWRWRRRP